MHLLDTKERRRIVQGRVRVDRVRSIWIAYIQADQVIAIFNCGHPISTRKTSPGCHCLVLIVERKVVESRPCFLVSSCSLGSQQPRELARELVAAFVGVLAS